MAYRVTIKTAYLLPSRFSTAPVRYCQSGKHLTTRMHCSLWCSAVSWRHKRFATLIKFLFRIFLLNLYGVYASFPQFTNLDNIYAENRIITGLSRTGTLYYNVELVSFMHPVWFVTDPHDVTKHVPVPVSLHPSIPSATIMWEILHSRPDEGDGVHLHTVLLYHYRPAWFLVTQLSWAQSAATITNITYACHFKCVVAKLHLKDSSLDMKTIFNTATSPVGNHEHIDRSIPCNMFCHLSCNTTIHYWHPSQPASSYQCESRTVISVKPKC
jgi:hypothetical protein